MSTEATGSDSPHLQAEKMFAGLSAYQHALTAHVDWLQSWYGAILNWGDESRPPPKPGGCAFTSWFDGAVDTTLAGYPAFAELGQLHRDIHFKADQIIDRAVGGHTVTTSDYEAMMALVLAFSTTAQGLERDVWRTLATVDALTGLGNRQTMMSHLVGERDRAIRQAQPCCVGLADIDHFKKINDTFGHATGDRVLRAVSECLRGAVRPYDILYRYGGEEFLVCLPSASQEAGMQVLERMRAAIAALDLKTESGRAIPVTASFGLSELTADLSVEESLDRADNALYDGKRAGRNRVVAYNDSMDNF
ncbi:MAG: diguanylate cyclase [Magnetospirillum sp.]|nr:diguanylate cyclase [Magnetospirillum sp.]MBI3708001.1 diguanylate cyclase [Pseudomonadota bacterium]